eukprot:7910434-Prorocentrum_lima.AAC.1
MAVFFTIDIDWAPVGGVFLAIFAPAFPSVQIRLVIGVESTTVTNAGRTMEYLSELKASGIRL